MVSKRPPEPVLTPAMGAALQIGIVGCGDYGKRHIRRLLNIPGVRVAALAEPSPSALNDAARMLPEPPLVVDQDYRRLLGLPLDAVCIASPDLYHVQQVVDCLEAGFHVLCEKPLTASARDLGRVIRTRDGAGRIVAMTYQRRYDGAHRAMRREIRSGRWGAVKAVTVYNSEDWITPNLGTWRHDPAICPGGFFYDAGGHQLDMVFWVTGLYPQRVRASCHNAATRVPIRVWGEAVIGDDVPMTFHFVGDAKVWREQVNIHCEGMDFLVENFKPRWCREGQPAELEGVEIGEGSDVEFVRMIREHAPNPAPPEDLWPVVQFTRAALRSAASSSRSVRVPPIPAQAAAVGS